MWEGEDSVGQRGVELLIWSCSLMESKTLTGICCLYLMLPVSAHGAVRCENAPASTSLAPVQCTLSAICRAVSHRCNFGIGLHCLIVNTSRWLSLVFRTRERSHKFSV